MVHEWSVMATDALLALACATCAIRTARKIHPLAEAAHTILAAVGVIAIAAVVGSIRHGWGPNFSADTYGALRMVSYVLIVLAGNLLMWGAIKDTIRDDDLRKAWRAFCSIKFLLAAFLYLANEDLRLVVTDWLMTMTALTLTTFDAFYKKRVERHWLLGAVALSVMAGLIQHGLVVGTAGTLHDDLCHLIQIPAMYCFSRVALVMPAR